MGLESIEGESRRDSHPIQSATGTTAPPHTGAQDVAAQRSKRLSFSTCIIPAGVGMEKFSEKSAVARLEQYEQ